MSRYQFLNLNPLGEREKDCVCRAISLALDEDYGIIQRKIQLVGELFECEFLCVCCYKFLLDEVYGLERIEEIEGMSIGEFLDLNPKGTYIIRVPGHLNCCIDGICYDIWDCRDEQISYVWKVN